MRGLPIKHQFVVGGISIPPFYSKFKRPRLRALARGNRRSLFFFFKQGRLAQAGCSVTGAAWTTLCLQPEPVFILSWQSRAVVSFRNEGLGILMLPSWVYWDDTSSSCYCTLQHPISAQRERELSPARSLDFQQCFLLNVSSTHVKERFATLSVSVLSEQSDCWLKPGFPF